MPRSSSSSSLSAYELFAMFMPFWGMIPAGDLEPAALTYFLLVLSLTPFCFTTTIQSQKFKYGQIASALCVEIPLVTCILSSRHAHRCECIAPVTEDHVPTTFAKIGLMCGLFLLAHVVCIGFLYGVMSMRGLSDAEMGPIGETFRTIYECSDPANSSQPEVIDEVAPPPGTENSSNDPISLETPNIV